MKLNYILPVLVIAVLLVSGCASKETGPKTITETQQETAEPSAAETPSNFLTWEDSNGWTRIKYPSDWKQRSGGGEYFILFDAPKGGGVATAWVYNPTCDDKTLTESVNKIINTELKTPPPEVEINSVEDTSLAGTPAKKVTYTEDPAGDGEKNLVIYSIKNGIRYGVGYSASYANNPAKSAALFNRHLNAAQKIINSFEILSAKPPCTTEEAYGPIGG